MNISPVNNQVNTAAAGMNAGAQRLDNAANVNTQNVRPQQAGQAEAAARQQPAAPAREQRADVYEAGAGNNPAEARRSDFERDMTDMISERNTYDANMRAARAQNETAGTAIDLVA